MIKKEVEKRSYPNKKVIIMERIRNLFKKCNNMMTQHLFINLRMDNQSSNSNISIKSKEDGVLLILSADQELAMISIQIKIADNLSQEIIEKVKLIMKIFLHHNQHMVQIIPFLSLNHKFIITSKGFHSTNNLTMFTMI